MDYSRQQLGHYHIIEKLGQGGMATVYKAFDTRLERDVAIKVVRKESIPPEQLERILKRFEREAKALAKFLHPNIVPVYDYGDWQGAPYLVMAYLPGGTLKSRIGSPVKVETALSWVIPMANALIYAHQRGVVHRDVKPSNILTTEDGSLMLSDFGIARILEESTTQLTAIGMGVGTPEYMAPEQWQGKATVASDQYALGVVLYELLTGRKPFSADTPLAVALKVLSEPLPHPSLYAPEISEDMEKVLLKVLARDPENRYQTMEAFRVALEDKRNIEKNIARPEISDIRFNPQEKMEVNQSFLSEFETYDEMSESFTENEEKPGAKTESSANSKPNAETAIEGRWKRVILQGKWFTNIWKGQSQNKVIIRYGLFMMELILGLIAIIWISINVTGYYVYLIFLPTVFVTLSLFSQLQLSDIKSIKINKFVRWKFLLFGLIVTYIISVMLMIFSFDEIYYYYTRFIRPVIIPLIFLFSIKGLFYFKKKWKLITFIFVVLVGLSLNITIYLESWFIPLSLLILSIVAVSFLKGKYRLMKKEIILISLLWWEYNFSINLPYYLSDWFSLSQYNLSYIRYLRYDYWEWLYLGFCGYCLPNLTLDNLASIFDILNVFITFFMGFIVITINSRIMESKQVNLE